MSLLDYNTIPGYAAAANEEAVNRELAFLPVPVPICGIPIRHYNARHHMLLCGCGNRFVVGGKMRPEDVAMFLWFLSPEYSTDAKARAAFVKKRVNPLEYGEAVAAICRYVDSVFQDALSGTTGGGGKQFFASIAGIVDLLASEYGWADEAILEMPLARIFQYTRRITQRHNPKAMLFNRSERHVSEWLRAGMTQPQTDGSN